MRLDSVAKFPYQLTPGPQPDESLVYRMGRAIGEQCKRLGIQVNYAPAVDINNNPRNPVIGFRSFGENREKVTRFESPTKGHAGCRYHGLRQTFSGHGDVDVDSHNDLPLISKSSNKWIPWNWSRFAPLFNAGVGSVMIAHLSIPAIDSGANRATSISGTM